MFYLKCVDGTINPIQLLRSKELCKIKNIKKYFKVLFNKFIENAGPLWPSGLKHRSLSQDNLSLTAKVIG